MVVTVKSFFLYYYLSSPKIDNYIIIEYLVGKPGWLEYSKSKQGY